MKAKRDNIRPLEIGEAVTLSIGGLDLSGNSQEAVVNGASRRFITLSLHGDDLSQARRTVESRCYYPATVTAMRDNGLRVFSGRARFHGGRLAFTQTKPPLGIQRRRDFRLPLISRVLIVRTSGGLRSAIRAELVDLSGGGARFESESEFAPGEVVQFSAPLGASGDEELIDAIVLACAPCSDSTLRYTVRLSFDDDSGRVRLSESMRDEIVRYLFARQREMLKLRALLAPTEEAQKPRRGGLALVVAKLRGAL